MEYNAPFSLMRVLSKHHRSDSVDFYSYFKTMEKELENQLENRDFDYFDLSRKALTGNVEAVPYFINEIEKYLIKRPFTGNIPEYYRNIAEGLFHEWKGFSSLHEWFSNKKYSQSSGLQIIGTNCFYREKGVYRPFPYKIPSKERADRLLRQLLANNPRLGVDKSNPDAELNMVDPLWTDRFLRVAIWTPERVWDNFTTITIRRQIVEYLNLEEQVGTGSIPVESIQLFHDLTRTGRRIIVAGPVDSGKSTFANTLVGEQLQHSNEKVGLIMIEKHPESLLPIVFKDHRIIPVKAEDHELMDVGIQSLRMDPQIVFMTEMRYYEWEFFLYAGEKGHQNLIGTYHTPDAEDIPYQAANALHSLRGGSLRGHLITALKSCEIVIIMQPNKDGGKRVVRVSEICFDEEKNSVYANDIMQYDPHLNKWLFNDRLSDSMIQNMKDKDPVATDRLVDNLRKLAAEHPIKDPIRVSIKSQMVL